MDELDDLLIHFGIKGMRWGVRKKREQSGYKIHGDGRIEIEPGVKMQRLVTSNLKDKTSRPLNGYSYMSFHPSDNAQYIHKMAPNSKAKGSDLKRDAILTLKTKHALKSPSLDEAQQINIGVMKKNADELKEYSKAVRENKKFSLSKEADSYFNMINHELAEFDNLAGYMHNKEMAKEFEIMRKQDPVTLNSDMLYRPEKYPAYSYAIANRHIANDDPDIAPFKNQLLGAIESKGYNMIRDEADVRTGLWTAPVIVLKPEKNVEVVLSKKISRMKLRQAQQYVEKGKRELELIGS